MTPEMTRRAHGRDHPADRARHGGARHALQGRALCRRHDHRRTARSSTSTTCASATRRCQVLMMRLKSDLLPALLATADGVLDDLRPALARRAALTVVMAAKGYPGDYAQGHARSAAWTRRARSPGVEVFHAGTRRDGDRLLADRRPRAQRHGARQDGRRGAASAPTRPSPEIDWPGGFYRTRHRLAGDRPRGERAHERHRRSVSRLRRAAHQNGRRGDLPAHRRDRSAAAVAARLSADPRRAGTKSRPSWRGIARW